MRPLVDLDDAAAAGPGVVGAKAFRLGEARRHGLPALAGTVVPVAAGRQALAAAVRALAAGGSGAARLAAMEAAVDEDLLADLTRAVRRLGCPVVVRSSSPLESPGVWAGAFSSFEGIGPDDLRTALRGVWASAFSVDALERCEAAGIDPAEVELAVLVQPQVDPDCGGSAQCVAGGRVLVHGTKGSPRDLMSGWETGVRARVAASGAIEGAEALALLGEAVLRGVGRLVRQVRDALGDDLVEWAWHDGGTVLLQSGRLPRPSSTAAPGTLQVPARSDLDHPLALRVARLAQRFPGPLGEDLVLAWAPALPDGALAGVPAAGGRCTDPVADLARAAEEASALTSAAWRADPGPAREMARAALAALRGPEPGPVLRRLAALPPADARLGREVVRRLAGIGGWLAARGLLQDPSRVWRQPAGVVEALLRGERGAPGDSMRVGPDRWEPFVHAVVRAAGRCSRGTPAVPGIGAGPVVVVADPHAPPPVPDRSVVVAERPLPALSPLLWQAAALVTVSGNPAAHLVEVAASLGTPTVLGVECLEGGALAELSSRSLLAGVDGAEGVVAFAAC